MSQQMATALRPHVTEGQARAVAEAARETEWRQPSFAKELYLGRFRLDLVHPRPAPGDQVAGSQFLARLRAFCETCDGQLVEREAQIPDSVVQGLAELGAFGIKIPQEYGGLGLSQVFYNRALILVGSVHPSISALLEAYGIKPPCAARPLATAPIACSRTPKWRLRPW